MESFSLSADSTLKTSIATANARIIDGTFSDA